MSASCLCVLVMDTPLLQALFCSVREVLLKRSDLVNLTKLLRMKAKIINKLL